MSRYSIHNFITLQEFNKNFANHIIRGRDESREDAVNKLGQDKLRELQETVDRITIRRMSTVMARFLPKKIEFIVCCKMREPQCSIYKKATMRFLSLKETLALKTINELRKVCSHPRQLKDGRASLVVESSSKFAALVSLLAVIRASGPDKVVLVSNYTETLDIFEKLCETQNYEFARLDGSSTISKRGKTVTAFSDPKNTNVFILLLSSKAGGCGLNLISANRLIMYDPDWNPAVDDQAMARIWRQGQQKT
jgi:DNA repair and recombination RAD54-like protein